jgi:tRNA nucleotidyltransferase/poly(A) polymerase
MSPAQRVREQLEADTTWAAALAALAGIDAMVYVVGGTVRDALLGRAGYDLDLAIDGSAIDVARTVADALGGAFFVMDAERDVARVLVRRADGWRQIDLAGLREPSIDADLRARDFTVNAIALSVAPWGQALLDPTGGLADLALGRLRLASASALSDDPVRVLRLVRMQGLLDFQVDKAAERAAVDAAPLLARATPERIRDEVLGILALKGCAAAWRYAASLGLIEHGLSAELEAARLECALQMLGIVAAWQAAARQGGDLGPLQPYGAGLAAFWEKELSIGRPRRLLTRLALLLDGISADEVARDSHLRRLCLSRREAEHIAGALAGREALAGLVAPSAIELHRYYRTRGSAGVDGAVLALAQAIARGDESMPSFGADALRAWFMQYDELVEPPSLISGGDVMRALQVAPGPLIGALLTAVREAQVTGAVHTPAEGLALAARLAAQGSHVAQKATSEGD